MSLSPEQIRDMEIMRKLDKLEASNQQLIAVLQEVLAQIAAYLQQREN